MKDKEVILEYTQFTTKVSRFVKYLSESENIKKLHKIFPLIATTCISAYHLGKPEPLFDMTIYQNPKYTLEQKMKSEPD